jgi:hypothetical protein
VTLLFEDDGSPSRRTRNLAYHHALQELHRDHPDDAEIGAFHGLSLLGIDGGRVTISLNQKREAAEVLWPYFEQGSNHPGVLHYLLHSLSAEPETARKALPVARRYAEAAPGVPHAQHMPAHIYTRLGMWKEVMQATRAADQAAAELARRLDRPPEKREFRNAPWKLYAYLQLGQRAQAKAHLDEIREVAEGSKAPPAVSAYVDMSYRYLLDGRRWEEAARAKPVFFWYQEVGNLAHAQALGGAFSGNRPAARQGLGTLQRAEQLTVPRLQAEAALAMLDGDLERMIYFMETAVRKEDTQNARSGLPIPPIPGHELFGEMLLRMNPPPCWRTSRPLGLVARSSWNCGPTPTRTCPSSKRHGSWAEWNRRGIPATGSAPQEATRSPSSGRSRVRPNSTSLVGVVVAAVRSIAGRSFPCSMASYISTSASATSVL